MANEKDELPPFLPRRWEPGEGPQRYIRELEAQIEKLTAALVTIRDLDPTRHDLIAQDVARYALWSIRS